ncbi:MAG: ribosome small subunit-dependent GTPase A [Janthinobacterium lividum]
MTSRASANLLTGRVVASHGRHYVVAPSSGERSLHCFPRGKKSELAVGDQVKYEQTSADQGVIAEVVERRNLLYRSDFFKTKLFAANLDQILIVLATAPHFSEDLLGRALIAAESLDIPARIVLNKADLDDLLPQARKRLALYTELGYEIIELSARQAPTEVVSVLAEYLTARTTLLVGQSGMGKSTLLNLLVPGTDARTREISTALNSGRHTTTFTRLYSLPQGGDLIDSPGFQEFGLHHLTEGKLERAFPEFRPHLGKCRFTNCRHLKEPGCAVLNAVADGQITPARHLLYAQLVQESEKRGW